MGKLLMNKLSIFIKWLQVNLNFIKLISSSYNTTNKIIPMKVNTWENINFWVNFCSLLFSNNFQNNGNFLYITDIYELSL
jgi:hypothetical protein